MPVKRQFLLNINSAHIKVSTKTIHNLIIVDIAKKELAYSKIEDRLNQESCFLRSEFPIFMIFDFNKIITLLK